MTLTIDLSQEEEARLEEEARRCGVDLRQYARQKLGLSGTGFTPEDEAALLAGLGTPEEEEEDERLWQEKFAAHPEVIARLLAEAEEDIREGRTAPLDDLLEEVR